MHSNEINDLGEKDRESTKVIHRTEAQRLGFYMACSRCGEHQETCECEGIRLVHMRKFH